MFDLIVIDKEEFKICSSCNGNFSAYKDGSLSFEGLVSDYTEPNLKEYFKQFSPDERTVEKVKQQEQKIHNKLMAQENDPLYDDIHQMAGDLRFIKNLIIIGLVCGFILGIIGVLGII